MKKNFEGIGLSITLVFSLAAFFVAPSFSFAATTIPCAGADSANYCGIGGYSLDIGSPTCQEKGNDIELQPQTSNGQPQQVRILGDQVCSFGGNDSPGYYTYNMDSPFTTYLIAAQMPGYDGSGHPPGWTYNKIGGFLFSSIPTGEFQEGPYYIDRFFPGDAVVPTLPSGWPDDEMTLQVGSQTDDWLSSTCSYTDVAGNKITQFTGPGWMTANPGDPITYSVTNWCRPNNGSAQSQWGGGTIDVALNLTACYTKAEMDYLNSQVQGTFQNPTDYHPTANGVCTPSQPALNAAWQATGNIEQTITLTPDQTSVSVPFTYGNTGQPTSIEQGITCQPTLEPGSNLPVGAVKSAKCTTTILQN